MPTAKVSSPSTDHQAEQDINQSETVFKNEKAFSQLQHQS